MIKGATIIMVFYLLGMALSKLMAEVIPGSVCGMLLLFLALKFGAVKAEDVKGVATTLTDNMALFFVPIGVGIISSLDIISDNIAAFIIVPLATTPLVIAVVGLIQQLLEERRK